MAPPRLAGGTRAALALAVVGTLSMGLVPGQPAQAAKATGSAERSARANVCGDPGPFTPSALSIPGIANRARVIPLGRDRRRVPKSPPVSDNRSFAWDKTGRKPGSQTAVVKMNTHTYPDGSAMGNRLLNGLFEGDVIVVHGTGGQSICYDVVDRTQVPAEKRVRSYYRRQGPPRLGIVVCSGVRRGPGDWSHRTIWYAAPRIPLDSAEPFK